MGRLSARVAFLCPRCSGHFDSASNLTSKSLPKEGDIGVCVQCAAPMRYLSDRAAEWLTYGDIDDMDNEIRVLLLKAIVAVLTMRPSQVQCVETAEPS